MANYMNNMKSNVETKMMNKVYNGTITLEQLLALDKQNVKIDMNKCENKIQVMQLIYEPNSEVGACTVIAGNMYTAIIETNEELEEYKGCLKHLKERSSHKPYGESLWIEGYNMFKNFNFKTGQYYVYYVVTNKEMEMLKEKIEGMNKADMTLEDVYALQADLPPFVRAWQESSIDVTKDKDKKFKYSYKDFFKMLNVVSTYNKKNSEGITNNLAAVKKDPSTPFAITLPSENADIAICNDMLGLANYAIKDETEAMYNDNFLFMYSAATMDRYAKFTNYARENRELAFFIKNIYKICQASLDGDDQISKEQYAYIRNVIYTKALELCIDKHEVINIAISTAMCNIYKDKDNNIVVKDAVVDNFRAFPVKDIFEKEFYEAVTDKTWTDVMSTKHIVDMTRDIADGETIEVKNGKAVDGSIKLDVEFTGKLTEENGRFIYEADAYEFELTKGLLVDTTFDEKATAKSLTFDNGQYFARATRNITTAIIKGKNHNILASDRLLGKFDYSMPVEGTVQIVDIISYERKNVKEQQLFLLIVK